MLLQKTGWRIKQLISHRRTQSTENPNDKYEEGLTEKRPSTSSRRLSWLSQSPPTEFLTLQRSSSNATSRSQPISKSRSQTIETAQSSSSSLCSCDCMLHSVPVQDSLFTSDSPLAHPEILYLPQLSSTHTTGDARTWQLIFSRDQPLLEDETPNYIPGRTPTPIKELTFDLYEALGMEPLDDDRTPTQSLLHTDYLDSDELSENVEQLIRETDQAFKAVGDALADAKAATQGWYDTQSGPQQPRSILRRTTQATPVYRTAPVARVVSGPKGKRRKAKKRMNILNRAIPPAPSNTPSRWTLNEVTANVADVFSGKIFRTEADEMLTPERIQRLKDGLEAERKASEESSRSSRSSRSRETDTPTDPFHLESFSTRITAAQKPLSSGPYPGRPASPRIKRRFQGKQLMARKVKFADQLVTPVGMIVGSTSSSPVPATKVRTNQMNKLPTIPETAPLQGTYFLLQSTPFTLTSPLFRHGPIKIERRSRGNTTPSPQDESLDWTAFQMAILGTMDEDGGDQRDDWEWEADERELDSVVAWFEEFGFQGFGALEGPPASGPLLQDEDKEVYVHPQNWRSNDSEKIVDERQASEFEEWNDRLIGHKETGGLEARSAGATTEMVRRPSLPESLPPSPMLDLDVSKSLRQNQDLVPMGYNLGHDLGDFLDWETKNVRTLFESG